MKNTDLCMKGRKQQFEKNCYFTLLECTYEKPSTLRYLSTSMYTYKVVSLQLYMPLHITTTCIARMLACYEEWINILFKRNCCATVIYAIISPLWDMLFMIGYKLYYNWIYNTSIMCIWCMWSQLPRCLTLSNKLSVLDDKLFIKNKQQLCEVLKS